MKNKLVELHRVGDEGRNYYFHVDKTFVGLP